MQDLAREVARLQTRLHEGKEELRRLGHAVSPIGEAWVDLDYEPARLKIVAAAEKRWNSVAKEPYTVAWLERSLQDGDVFYDIGANIGAYSLIAAAASPESVRVIAFEPGYDNYSALCANIVLNELGNRIVALPVLLGSSTALTPFRYRRLGVGVAQHDSLGEASWEPVYEQPMLAYRLDDLVRQFKLPPPTHVKVDVDGAEVAVLQGAEQTLASPALRELLVEVQPGDQRVEPMLARWGFEALERHQTPAAINVILEREPKP
jgi:FkbM family methyltransferase